MKLDLDEAIVRRYLRLEDVISAMEASLAASSAGQIVQPTRVMMSVAEHQGFLGLMPAYTRALGVKLVAFYPNNQGIPTHHAVILLFRPETGEPLVSMDGRLITEVRTGAVSAVATKLLARPEATVLAILGSGVQARSHLEALRLVGQFRDIRVWSPHHAAEFAREHGVGAVASAEEAVRGADVIVTATTSRTPVLRDEWLSPGAHVNAVGAARPDWRELDDEVLRRARIFVDSREAAMAESGDVIAASALVPGLDLVEIGEVAAGNAPGRRSPEDITLSKSLGMAVEDVVAADLVYREALRDGYLRE